LYNEAITQDRQLFKARGLTVLAAPWRYAMMTKLDRLMRSVTAKSYDLDDAVTYLHEIVVASHTPVPKPNLAVWANEFRCTPPSDALINSLAGAYGKKYNSAGLSVAVGAP
jgi:hypothetical protein